MTTFGLNTLPDPKRYALPRTPRTADWPLRILLLGFMAAAVIAGCVGRSKASYEGETHVKLEKDGSVTVDRQGKGKGEVQAAKGAATPSPLNVSEGGVQSEVGGEWEPKISTAVKDNKNVFYLFAGICGLAAIVAFAVFKQPVLSASCAAGAAAFAFTPELINRLGPWIPLAGGLAIVGGVVYVFGQRMHARHLKQVAAPDVAKLTAEGKTAEALAILRATDTRLNKAFKAKKK
jgi:hypothetical protein